jgi:hypothetical protein
VRRGKTLYKNKLEKNGYVVVWKRGRPNGRKLINA